VNDKLRYSMYMHVTATSTQLPRPERLPPTEDAARFHIQSSSASAVEAYDCRNCRSFSGNVGLETA